MPDREFATVAADIAQWQSDALHLPLPELQAMTSFWHKSLIESLNDFNVTYARHDGAEPSSEFEESIVAVVRQATALAIFAVGAAQRLHLAAHQN
jgi:hypothetical protein